MTQSIAILSVIPRLSYHLRIQLPNLTIFDVLPDKFDTLSKLQSADTVVADCNLFLPYTDKLPSVKWAQTTWAGIKSLTSNLRDKKIKIMPLHISQTKVYLQLCPIAEKLKMFGATIWQVTRTPLKENLNYLDEHRTIAHLSEMLTNCDYIINVLSSISSTLDLLNRNILQNYKNHGNVLINIGRGTIIKEIDLLNALEQQWISRTILDVFTEEPLPKESKL